MERYLIESVKCGVSEGGIACGPVGGPVVAEAKIKSDLGETFYLALAEFDGMPYFYKTEKSIFNYLVDDDYDEDVMKEIQDKYVGTGDYRDIIKNKDDEWYELYRYLIYIVRARGEEFEKYKDTVVWKYVDEMDIPASDIEEEYMEESEESEEFEFVLPDSKEKLYRLRLTLETDTNIETVFHDMDSLAFEMEKKQLEDVIAACESEEDYLTWKTAYIESELAKIGDQKYLVCSYIFAGIGQYEMIIPADELESFKCWINSNGSGFFGGESEATADDIRTFIALNAANGK